MAASSGSPAAAAISADSAFRAALDLRVIISRLRRRFLSVTGDASLTGAQASALRQIVRGDVTTASALARAEQVTPQAMAVTIGALEQRGYIVRTPDPADGRRQLIEATAQGRSGVQNARAAGREWLETALAERYTEDERQAIIATMTLLERLLDQ